MPRQPARPRNIAQLRQRLRTTLPWPGFFKLKMVRGGPWIPALIWEPCPMVIPEPWEELADPPEDWCYPTEPARYLRATIGEDEADPLEVWERGTKIPPHEYYWRLSLREWAIAYAPAQPEALPRQRVDLTRQPSLF